MSIGGSISGITFSGLASGIDTESIIQRLIQLQQRPLQRLSTRQTELRARMTAFDQFKGLINNFQTAASGLSSSNAFNLVKVISSDTNVATVTASPESIPGTYELTVSKLAQAHKLISGSHSSSTAELGATGKFILNGKEIQVAAGDSLSSIATKINNANTGVTASLLNGDNGEVFLTLTARNTGEKNRIHLSEVGSGTLLQSTLKLTDSSTSVRNPITNGARTDRFSDAGTAIGSLLGMSAPSSGTIQINGTDIEIDFASDTLTSIATKISNAGITGVSASVVSETENGTTYYRLNITGASTPNFTDNNSLLSNLGVVQKGYQNQLVAAQDAEFSLDGLSFKRSSNQITDVINGVTINLLSADATTPKRSTLTFSRDTDSIKRGINGFVDAFNSVVDFLKQTASFDKDTLRTGLLFGDSTVEGIRDALIRQITDQVQGVTGELRSLAQIGITLGEDGKLKVDDSLLTSKLSSDPSAVGRLFFSEGSVSNPNIQFVSSTNKTRASNADGYAIQITQVATKAAISAGMRQTDPSAGPETLTFNGALFGNQEYRITLNTGNDVEATIAQINNDPRLKNLVTASLDDSGHLKIEAKSYGSAANFTVISDLEPDLNNSGIGKSILEANGLDVEGTINGEAATGRGQFLRGNNGNPNTEGLEIRVLATTTGAFGTVKFTRGVGESARNYIQNANDVINGAIPTASKTLQAQIDAINDEAKRIQEEVARKEQSLREQFARLERTLSEMQSQSSRLSAMMRSA